MTIIIRPGQLRCFVLFFLFASCKDFKNNHVGEKGVKIEESVTYTKASDTIRQPFHDEGILRSSVFYYKEGSVKVYVKHLTRDLSYIVRYYRNGNIDSEGMEFKRLNIAEWRFYDSNAVLQFTRNYIIIGNDESINEYRYYLPNGEIDNEISNYLIIKTNKDTLSQGDELIVNIQLIPMYGDRMNLVVGKLDNKYQLIDSSKAVRIIGKDLKTEYRVFVKDKGLNSLEGVVEDIDTLSEEGHYFVRSLYFHREYYVK